jgi:O-antigen ligase
LIGRGLTFDVMSVAWMRPEFYMTPDFFFVSHGYHNGPLTLLVDFGLAGLITMTAFFITSIVRVFSLLKKITRSQTSDWGALCVMGYGAMYVEQVFHFYAFYGDMGDMFLRMMMLLLIVEVSSAGYLLAEKKQRRA